ncbi:MAG: hypothetical protein RLZZ611_1537, partial [Cyanobacteriota bacterium]
MAGGWVSQRELGQTQDPVGSLDGRDVGITVEPLRRGFPLRARHDHEPEHGPRSHLESLWQLCQTHVAVMPETWPNCDVRRQSRKHAARAGGRSQNPKSSQKKVQDLLLQAFQKMGRLRFELRTNRLKANWTSLRSLPAQGLLKAPPNTPPNKSAATGETILAESALERLQERDISRKDHRSKSSGLPSPSIPHRAAQR